ncbi:MAG: transposase [Candidatus Cloacimonetes bacterium]|nr:transposase [Candidatus Cloacimonadota bacterium]MDD4667603.1 transposase [Candidatus Cloacimonadota bacterium]
MNKLVNNFLNTLRPLHIEVGKAHGLVQAIEVTPANVLDGHMLIPLVESLELPEETEVLADKGYCSQENEDALHEQNLVAKIMRKKKGSLPNRVGGS